MIIPTNMTDTASVQSTLVDSTSNQTLVDQQQQLERSADVWFDDGNCVLQAENTVFKVYFGLLAKYSVYFQTMITLPQPDANAEEPQPMYENCPLIVLLGDSAKDARYFLKALTDIQFYYTDVMKINDVSIVLSIITMSLKYQADILLRRSIPAFSALYTANFARWDMRHTRRQYAPFVEAYGRALPYVVISLAKKAGLEMLLPSAMFECCGYPISDIMDGVAGPDGKYVHLDHESKKTILQARVLISNEASATKARIVQKAQLTYPNTNTRRQTVADAVRESSWVALTKWANDIDGPDGWVNPFKIAESWPTEAYFEVTRRQGYPVKKNIEGNYKQVWMRLPKVFGMREWHQLRRSWVTDF